MIQRVVWKKLDLFSLRILLSCFYFISIICKLYRSPKIAKIFPQKREDDIFSDILKASSDERDTEIFIIRNPCFAVSFKKKRTVIPLGYQSKQNKGKSRICCWTRDMIAFKINRILRVRSGVEEGFFILFKYCQNLFNHLQKSHIFYSSFQNSASTLSL